MIGTILIFAIILLGFYKERGVVLFVPITLCSVLIMGLNYANPDFENYVTMYDYAEYPSEFNVFQLLDIGFTSFQSFIKGFGYKEYSQFRIVLSGIIFLIYGITIYKNCLYPNLFMSIFAIFYLCLDQIQIRNFFAFVILLPFLLYFIKNNTTKGLIIYLVGVSLAFTVHYSSIFFCIFALVYFKSNLIRTIVIVFATGIIFSAGILTSDLAMLNRVDGYAQPSILGGTAASVLLLANWLFIKWIKCRYITSNKNSMYESVVKHSKLTLRKSYIEDYFNIIVTMNMLLLLLIPAIFVNVTILRIWRFMSVVNIIFILNLLYCMHKNKIKTKLSFFLILYCALISVWFTEEGVWESLYNNPIFN